MKYICKEDFYINEAAVGKEGDLIEAYDARPEQGEDPESVAGYCDIFNFSTGALFNATWSDIDEGVVQPVAEPVISFYECEFDVLDPNMGEQSMCIKGERIPTVEEANAFLAKDIEDWYHAPVVKVIPLTKDEAYAFFACDNEADWPVFR